MTEKKFMEIFFPMAMKHYGSLNAVKGVAIGYYNEVKDCSETAFYEAMIGVEKYYDNRNFPGPRELKQLCDSKLGKQKENKWIKCSEQCWGQCECGGEFYTYCKLPDEQKEVCNKCGKDWKLKFKTKAVIKGKFQHSK